MSKCGSGRFPSLHHRREAQARQRAATKGGVAASLIKYREATEKDAAGREARARQREAVIVVFLLVLNRKTTPASRSVEASQYFFDCSATPPFFRLRAVALALRGPRYNV